MLVPVRLGRGTQGPLRSPPQVSFYRVGGWGGEGREAQGTVPLVFLSCDSQPGENFQGDTNKAWELAGPVPTIPVIKLNEYMSQAAWDGPGLIQGGGGPRQEAGRGLEASPPAPSPGGLCGLRVASVLPQLYLSHAFIRFSLPLFPRPTPNSAFVPSF